MLRDAFSGRIRCVSLTRVSGEELAAKVGGRVGEALDLRRVQVAVEQLDAPFELAAHPKRSRWQ
jgi:hypothetical protein